VCARTQKEYKKPLVVNAIDVEKEVIDTLTDDSIWSARIKVDTEATVPMIIKEEEPSEAGHPVVHPDYDMEAEDDDGGSVAFTSKGTTDPPPIDLGTSEKRTALSDVSNVPSCGASTVVSPASTDMSADEQLEAAKKRVRMEKQAKASEAKEAKKKAKEAEAEGKAKARKAQANEAEAKAQANEAHTKALQRAGRERAEFLFAQHKVCI